MIILDFKKYSGIIKNMNRYDGKFYRIDNGKLWKNNFNKETYWNITCTNFNKCFSIEIENMPKIQFIKYLKQHGWYYKNKQWYCNEC